MSRRIRVASRLHREARERTLIAELGGEDARESVPAWFTLAFHPGCGVVLVRDGKR